MFEVVSSIEMGTLEKHVCRCFLSKAPEIQAHTIFFNLRHLKSNQLTRANLNA